MKVLFDTNVYVAEALLGDAAERMLTATRKASWRIFTSSYVLAEIERVMVERLGYSRRFALLTRRRAQRRAILVEPSRSSRHQVPGDPDDSPILQAALAAGADYLVTNDTVLLALSGYEGLRILSMSDYYRLLQDRQLLA
jgi:putative PIN family toxin of toxin-antitoxin system